MTKIQQPQPCQKRNRAEFFIKKKFEKDHQIFNFIRVLFLNKGKGKRHRLPKFEPTTSRF